MIMEKNTYSSSIKGNQSLIIYGNIKNEKVQFDMFDKEQILIDSKKIKL